MKVDKKGFTWWGVFFILVGLICNGWLWSKLIPTDSLLNTEANPIFVWLIDLALLVVGVYLLKRPQTLLKNLRPLAFSLLFFVVLFLAGDIYLGYLKAIQPSAEFIENVHIPDEQLGWRPKPNAVGVHRSDQFDVSYRMDERGFKAIDNVGPTALNLYFFGDSYTFGHGVPNEDTFPNIIAAQYLSATVHVYNAAVMGYGFAQMYQRFLAVESQLKPGDIVIFTPLSRDIERNFKDFMFPSQFVFNESEIQVDSYPYYDQGTIKYTRLHSLINKFKTLLFNAQYTGKNFQFLYRILTQPDTTSEAQEMLNQAKLLTEARGAKFLLIFLPRRTEASRGDYEFDISGFQYHDIRTYFPSNDSEIARIGFAEDSHWNRLGHELAAMAIVDTLIQEQLLPEKYLIYTPQQVGTVLADQIKVDRIGRHVTPDTLDRYVLWEIVSPASHNYTVFIQLLDEHGQRVSGVDLRPERDFTTLGPHEKLATYYTLPLPDAPGRYSLLLGLYYFEDDSLVNIGAVTLPEPVVVE
jgi:lysophospholipase L1-like esterase